MSSCDQGIAANRLILPGSQPENVSPQSEEPPDEYPEQESGDLQKVREVNVSPEPFVEPVQSQEPNLFSRLINELIINISAVEREISAETRDDVRKKAMFFLSKAKRELRNASLVENPFKVVSRIQENLRLASAELTSKQDELRRDAEEMIHDAEDEVHRANGDIDDASKDGIDIASFRERIDLLKEDLRRAKDLLNDRRWKQAYDNALSVKQNASKIIVDLAAA